MILRNKSGFIINGRFIENGTLINSVSHEKNAMEIIRQNGWSKEWNRWDAQDFIVCAKGAIQIGSALSRKTIVASKRLYSKSDIEKIARQYGISDYRIDLVYDP